MLIFLNLQNTTSHFSVQLIQSYCCYLQWLIRAWSSFPSRLLWYMEINCQPINESKDCLLVLMIMQVWYKNNWLWVCCCRNKEEINTEEYWIIQQVGNIYQLILGAKHTNSHGKMSTYKGGREVLTRWW